MTENYQPQLIWQNEQIGMLDNPVPDMWYLEGPWISNNTEAAKAFEALAKDLNFKITFADLDRGIEVFLKSEDDFLLRAIVISLTSEHSLFVRRMHHPKEIDSNAMSASHRVEPATSSKLNKENIFQEIRNYLSFIARLFEK